MTYYNIILFPVELDDRYIDEIADHLLQLILRYRIECCLGTGEKRRNADIDRKASLDPLNNLSFKVTVFLICLENLVPDLDATSLFLA